MASSATLIITADDFGCSPEINHGIVESLRRGLVTHASLIANMAWTGDACERAHALALRDRIGCHLNLAVGVPLTERIRRARTFCSDGIFNEPLSRGRFRPLPADDARALAEETRAQIAAVRAHGFAAAHLDSHRAVHTMPNVLPIVAAVAKEMGVSRVRPYVNCGPTVTGVKKAAKALANGWLRARGFSQVDFFGTIDDVMLLARGGVRRPALIEVMTHPAPAGADGTIHDAGLGPLDARVAGLVRLLGAPVVASGAHAALR